MSDAPERIWAEPPTTFDEFDVWHLDPRGEAAEYIRADIHAAALARIKELEAEVADLQDTVSDANDEAQKWHETANTHQFYRAEAEGKLAEAVAREREACAEIADAAMEKYAAATYQNPEARMQNAAKTYCAGDIAAAIRARSEVVSRDTT